MKIWEILLFSRYIVRNRYTDITNDDNQVRKLLTAFISSVKQLFRSQHDKQHMEYRIMWLINMIKWVHAQFEFAFNSNKIIDFTVFRSIKRLLNLLKQYGGLEEYMESNTSTQNEQQLKNFDLSEYR